MKFSGVHGCKTDGKLEMDRTLESSVRTPKGQDSRRYCPISQAKGQRKDLGAFGYDSCIRCCRLNEFSLLTRVKLLVDSFLLLKMGTIENQEEKG